MGIRWKSVATVAGAVVVALVFFVTALRGRVWAWLPCALAVAVAVRELRWLQRDGRRGREAGFDQPRR
ncbi:hypothetical protein [Puerhibacterium puerhi]|uniref:hypothetical protein n=1 Tax=Puerhibacterium puerhi TaxID=2692623 RepID=UPI00135B400E|nr:hypothetical protein [Puerhibacterium puerhi]